MGALGNSITSIVGTGIDAVMGVEHKPKGTNLENFLSKFGSSKGNWIDTIDPLETFDVKFSFQPSPEKEKEASSDGSLASIVGKIGASAISESKKLVNNLANNLTGGLLNSIMSNGSGSSIMDRHNKFDRKNTFLEYLASANLLVGSEDWVGESASENVSPLILQLGPYVQTITIPQMKTMNEGKSDTPLGSFPINGTFVIPDNNNLVMTVLNTKVPLHERIFYPWMREVTLPYWSYSSQPYTTATIEVDFTKHNDTKYIFTGCRPNSIYMQQPKQTADGDGLTRQVSFIFDFMFITSSLSFNEDLPNKLFSTGKEIFNSASKMIGL